MRILHFEDIAVGTELPDSALAVTAEDAAFFSAAFGPGEAGLVGASGGPAALSGFHVAAIGMRLLYDAVLFRVASLGAPGIDAVTWPRPVRVGDVLRFTARVTAARISVSRPEMGLVTVAIALFNQDCECAMTQVNTLMVARRAAEVGE